MALPDGFPPVDFEAFHRDRLAAWATTERGAMAGRSAAHLASIAISIVGGGAFTYRSRDGRIEVLPGADAATVVEMELESWQGFVHDLEAPAGLVYADRVRCARGNAGDFMAWETPLRALYHGRPSYDPACSLLRDRLGRPLDVDRAFTLRDDPTDMAHFLRVAGYLLVRQVFSDDEVVAFLADADALWREAKPGDRLSWWGEVASGEKVLCRVTRGAGKERLASLRTDPRLLALAALADAPLVHQRGEGDGVAVIFKRPGVTDGLGDLPWHRDCGLGGHAAICPTAVASVFFTEGSPASGELAFLPGSRETAFNAHDPPCRGALPRTHFHARAGDVTFHYGDTVHSAPPPADPTRSVYRISAIVGFGRPHARHHRGESSYNAALHRRDDGQIERLTMAPRSR